MIVTITIPCSSPSCGTTVKANIDLAKRVRYYIARCPGPQGDGKGCRWTYWIYRKARGEVRVYEVEPWAL